MEIPQIVIPEIPVIHIPTTNQSLNIALPKINMAGCTKTHRDVSVKNTQIIFDDLNGSYYSCPAGHGIPSYIPINYDPKKLEYIEESKPQPINTPPPPPKEKPIIPPNEEKDIVLLTDCPDPNSNRRIGDYANDKKLERIVAFERDSEGICQTIYEQVPFQEQYIPPVSLVINTAVIATVAASTPLIINLVKPIIKNLIKKLTKKKETNQNQ